MKLFNLIISLLIIAVPFTHSKAQPNSSVDTNKLSQFLNVLHQNQGFSGELLVAKNGEILFQRTTGLANVENRIDLKNGQKYRIASLTKSFTATLLATAQEEDKIDLQEKAIAYLPELSPDFKEITIGQLITHTSGLPHNKAIKNYWLRKSKLSLSTEEVIQEINALELLSEPGTQMHYSSLGYYLLATILEEVYQKDFHMILKEKILTPLSMTETGNCNTLAILPSMTSGYHWMTDDSLVVAPYRNYSMLKGAGDLYSTTTDLLKWTNYLLSRQSPLDSLHLLSVGIDTFSTQYGFGWYQVMSKPLKFYHGGGTWGFSSYLAFYPESGISIILLSNVSSLPMTSIGKNVEHIVFDRPFQLPTVKSPIPADSLKLERYTGKFVSESNHMTLTMTKSENRLFAQLAGNPAFEVYPQGEHQFFGRKVEVIFTFKLVDGRTTAITAERNGQFFQFTKVDR